MFGSRSVQLAGTVGAVLALLAMAESCAGPSGGGPAPVAQTARELPDEATSRQELDALAARLADSGTRGDLVAFARCLAPAERPLFSYSMYTMVSVATAVQQAQETAQSREQLAALQALLSKYDLERLAEEIPEDGIDGEQFREWLLQRFSGLDHFAFLGDVVAVLGELEGGVVDFEGGLRDLVIEGDRARGVLGGVPASFVFTDGAWYYSVAEE